MLCVMEIGTKRQPDETESVAEVPGWLMSLHDGVGWVSSASMSQINSDTNN